MFDSEHDHAKYQSGEPLKPEEITEEGIIISPDTYRSQRIPPGQARTRKWPILHASHVPNVEPEDWRLKIFGLVEREIDLDWDQFRALPRCKVFADFHCVTRWSRLSNIWEGVSTQTLLKLAGVKPEAKYVVCHAYDNGWSTNMPLEDFLADDALLADTHDELPINDAHGGPVRGMVPRLYAWKSAKWIRGIELTAKDKPGYWERGGFHNHGDPWTEERFGY